MDSLGFPFGIPTNNTLATFDVFDTGINMTTPPALKAGFFDLSVTFSPLDWGGTGSLQNVQLTNVVGFTGPSPTISFAGPGATFFILNMNGAIVPAGTGGVGAGSLAIQLTPLHPAPVPAPSAMLLFGTGLIGLIAIARRKSMKA